MKVHVKNIPLWYCYFTPIGENMFSLFHRPTNKLNKKQRHDLSDLIICIIIVELKSRTNIFQNPDPDLTKPPGSKSDQATRIQIRPNPPDPDPTKPTGSTTLNYKIPGALPFLILDFPKKHFRCKILTLF